MEFMKKNLKIFKTEANKVLPSVDEKESCIYAYLFMHAV